MVPPLARQFNMEVIMSGITQRMEAIYTEAMYGKHNSVSTIEGVYVDALRRDKECWEGIQRQEFEANKLSSWYVEITAFIEEMRVALQYYEDHKHLLLGGFSNGA